MRTDEAVKIFGTRKALAEAVGVCNSAVYKWGDQIPVSREKSVRLAMREKADQLEADAVRLRKASIEA